MTIKENSDKFFDQINWTALQPSQIFDIKVRANTSGAPDNEKSFYNISTRPTSSGTGSTAGTFAGNGAWTWSALRLLMNTNISSKS
jgi:hypothetical protein